MAVDAAAVRRDGSLRREEIFAYEVIFGPLRRVIHGKEDRRPRRDAHVLRELAGLCAVSGAHGSAASGAGGVDLPAEQDRKPGVPQS